MFEILRAIQVADKESVREKMSVAAFTSYQLSGPDMTFQEYLSKIGVLDKTTETTPKITASEAIAKAEKIRAAIRKSGKK